MLVVVAEVTSSLVFQCSTSYKTEYETTYEKKCSTQYETQYK